MKVELILEDLDEVKSKLKMKKNNNKIKKICKKFKSTLNI